MWDHVKKKLEWEINGVLLKISNGGESVEGWREAAVDGEAEQK